MTNTQLRLATALYQYHNTLVARGVTSGRIFVSALAADNFWLDYSPSTDPVPRSERRCCIPVTNCDCNSSQAWGMLLKNTRARRESLFAKLNPQPAPLPVYPDTISQTFSQTSDDDVDDTF